MLNVIKVPEVGTQEIPSPPPQKISATAGTSHVIVWGAGKILYVFPQWSLTIFSLTTFNLNLVFSLHSWQRPSWYIQWGRLPIYHSWVLRVYNKTCDILLSTKTKIPPKHLSVCININTSYKSSNDSNTFSFESSRPRIRLRRAKLASMYIQVVVQ